MFGLISQPGTFVHEGSHFQGAKDNVYSENGCKALAKSNPDVAILNAESYMYFIENYDNLD